MAWKGGQIVVRGEIDSFLAEQAVEKCNGVAGTGHVEVEHLFEYER